MGQFGMFMNDCMWAVFCLSEEGETFERVLVNHQIHKTQTIVDTVQARLQDVTNVAAKFCGIRKSIHTTKLAKRILE